MATVTITQANLDEVLSNNPIVFLDFWASWCAPCRAFLPVFETASELHKDIVFGKIDTEAEPELAAMFGIRSIPTLAVFREEIGVFSQPGALPPAGLEELVRQVRGLDMVQVRKSVEADESATASG